MKRFTQSMLLAAICGLGLLAQSTPDVAGDWQGTLKAGGAELRLVLHINKALAATLDSIDQPGANGIPAGTVTIKGSKLSFDVPAVSGSYEGTLNSAASAIDGTWTQGQSLPLVFKRTAAKAEPKPAPPSDIDGAWLGMLDAGGAKLRIVFHIVNTSDGLTATLDSPDQGAKGIPVTTVSNASLIPRQSRGL